VCVFYLNLAKRKKPQNERKLFPPFYFSLERIFPSRLLYSMQTRSTLRNFLFLALWCAELHADYALHSWHYVKPNLFSTFPCKMYAALNEQITFLMERVLARRAVSKKAALDHFASCTRVTHTMRCV
jgi:hypothetical protein